jgi:hypothetical protein
VQAAARTVAADDKPRGLVWRIFVIAWIAFRARHTGAAAAASFHAVPWPIVMVFADPEAIVASFASHDAMTLSQFLVSDNRP